ncbi:hypothetical protein BBD42_17330 [Paenibacillus sp. BIHB 4019]|uniref:Integrase catalytic domain-containing protein n=1 Tax=Paenibacillus sp. BIHB 4019 TaxID=1870819 RepID=A0A1B2DK10_9BACL|nr:hypothetical protein BBD42_17330 [Paenibacillus sp. BIHB 4019]
MKHGFICSMSRKGNYYDNSPMESFWGNLKMEWLNDYAFKTRAETKKAVFEYIELFYNRRRHEVSIRLIGVIEAFYVSTCSEQGQTMLPSFQ